MKQFITLTCSLFLFTFGFSQSVEFGDVTKAELQETICSIDSSANAAYLYKYRKTYFLASGSYVELITEIHEKVKIYNKDGFDYATKQINLFKSGNNSEGVGKIKAITYNLEGNKINETKLEKNQVFKSEFNHRYNQVKFTMPNIKEGSVIEYKYKISSPFYYSIDEFVFQEDIPIIKLEASFSAPNTVTFKPNFKGFIPLMPERDSKLSASLGMNVNIERYNLNNVPAIIEEDHVDNIRNYISGVTYEIKTVDLGTHYKHYSQSWSDVARIIGNTDDYQDDMKKTKPFRDAIDALTSSIPKKEDKMKAIFKYVKDNIKWNGADGKYFHRGIKKALDEKKGNSGDINLTLTSMLRHVGIDAHPIVICTKDNGIPVFPTLDKLNYVICYAKIDGKKYYLDATEEFSDINLLPERDYNWNGVMVNGRDMVWDLIHLPKPKQAVSQILLNAEISEDGEVEGTYKAKHINHFAFEMRDGLKDQDMDTYIANKEEDFDDIEISDYNVKNKDTYEGAVNEDFSFYHEDLVEVLEDKIIVNPMLFLALEENPFKLEERQYPIDFGYPLKEMVMANISLPQGYEIENQVKPFIAKLPNDTATFKYMISVNGNTIKLTSLVEFKNPKYAPDDYGLIKEFFNQIIVKQTEPIIFRKNNE